MTTKALTKKAIIKAVSEAIRTSKEISPLTKILITVAEYKKTFTLDRINYQSDLGYYLFDLLDVQINSKQTATSSPQVTEDYWVKYFEKQETWTFTSESVHVNRLNHMSIDQWIKEGVEFAEDIDNQLVDFGVKQVKDFVAQSMVEEFNARS